MLDSASRFFHGVEKIRLPVIVWPANLEESLRCCLRKASGFDVQQMRHDLVDVAGILEHNEPFVQDCRVFGFRWGSVMLEF